MTPDDIKRIRSAKNWTQLELSGVIGVALQTLQAWEQGRNPIPLWAVKALARIEEDRV